MRNGCSPYSRSLTIRRVLPPNRSLNLTLPRAEFFVRREYSKGSMLVVKQVLGDNTTNINATAVQNGQRRLAPNR